LTLVAYILNVNGKEAGSERKPSSITSSSATTVRP
jgi:hypothetical protein